MSLFLTGEWRYLAMLNYEIDPEVLLPFVPRGTELDAWEGKTYVSIVGFLFLNTKLVGVPIPFHTDFEELNLRFYVKRTTPEGVRRGVVFIKEIVPLIAIAWTARLFYNENYVTAPMRHQLQKSEAGVIESVRYEWDSHGRSNTLSLSVQGQPALVIPGSIEEFITEHYWGYAKQRDGGTVEYKVEHPSWQVWSGDQVKLDCDVTALYGESFAPFLNKAPVSAFLAEGSPVTVYVGNRMA